MPVLCRPLPLSVMRAFLLSLALLVATGCDTAGYDVPTTDGKTASTATSAPVAAAARAAGRPLTAELSGASEVTPGDPDGTGTARVTVNPGRREVCWDISLQNVDTPTRGHIHEAPAGVNGPVVLTFFETGQPVALTGCTTVTRALALEILQTPEDYYINLHNAAYPAGAVRGQLSR